MARRCTGVHVVAPGETLNMTAREGVVWNTGFGAATSSGSVSESLRRGVAAAWLPRQWDEQLRSKPAAKGCSSAEQTGGANPIDGAVEVCARHRRIRHAEDQPMAVARNLRPPRRRIHVYGSSRCSIVAAEWRCVTSSAGIIYAFHAVEARATAVPESRNHESGRYAH